MENIRKVFTRCKRENRSALVTYVTAGYPLAGESVDVLLGMEEGGADIIELGIPFTDATADGPTIRKANSQVLENGVTVASVLDIVRNARTAGLRAPVLLMGYYNPLLRYGEERMVRDARKAGANGFIVVDLPPEEARSFRRLCRGESMSYVPLIAPATSESRTKLLCEIADSFVYVVSRMGTTGATGKLAPGLPELLARVHTYSGHKPAALGFGVTTREHFLSVQDIAEGVVIGSQIIRVLSEAAPGQCPRKVKEYCSSITGRTMHKDPLDGIGWMETLNQSWKANGSAILRPVLKYSEPSSVLPTRFGEFGGQYVPESLMDCLAKLESGFRDTQRDPGFWEEYRSHYPYLGRPSPLHLAEGLTKHAGGANIYLKREDLIHTGSHHINNALGQVLLARRFGKTKIIADTGSGQHGVATAAVCAKFCMECVIYVPEKYIQRLTPNIFRMKILGASVVTVPGSLRDATNEALRAFVTEVPTAHYAVGSAIGPHPFPTIVRTLQSIIGEEVKEQMIQTTGKLPDMVVSSVGGGGNAVGLFSPFSNEPSVELLGVEAGGESMEADQHSATLSNGDGLEGVIYGARTYVLQDEHGQISQTESIAAGMDYPGVGPELSALKESGRATFAAVTDTEALSGFRLLSEIEGIIPSLESAHAVHGAIELAKSMQRGENVVLCLGGRGDKDVHNVGEVLPRLGPQIGWDLRL